MSRLCSFKERVASYTITRVLWNRISLIVVVHCLTSFAKEAGLCQLQQILLFRTSLCPLLDLLYRFVWIYIFLSLPLSFLSLSNIS